MEHRLTVKQMEDQLTRLCLRFLPNRSSHWELAEFPNMAAIYWNLARGGIVPEQGAFADMVAAQLGQNGNPDVIARAFRAYPALVRQHHFCLVLKEHFPFVVRSEELDLHGVDILVIENGSAYGIALSVATTSAHHWQAIKQVRHPDSPEHLPVLYLYARSNEYKVGDFWLHHPDRWKEVRNWIDNTRDHLDQDAALRLGQFAW